MISNSCRFYHLIVSPKEKDVAVKANHLSRAVVREQ
jgi:hypothetical protein